MTKRVETISMASKHVSGSLYRHCVRFGKVRASDAATIVSFSLFGVSRVCLLLPSRLGVATLSDLP